MFDVVDLPDAGDGIVKGEFDVRRRGRAARGVHGGPATDDAIGIGVQCGGGGGDVRASADDAGSAGEVHRRSDAAGESPAEIQGRGAEPSVAGIDAQGGRTAGDAQVAQRDAVVRRSAADILEGAAIQLKRGRAGDAVVQLLDAAVIPAKQGVADADRRGTGQSALIRQGDDVAKNGGRPRE